MFEKILHPSGWIGVVMNKNKIIEIAISKCRELIENYDDNISITDIDICELIEILKGRD